MIMKFGLKFTFFLTWILIGFSFGLRAQNIRVEARLDTSSIPLGDQTKLHVNIHLPAGTVLTYPHLKDSIGKLIIVGDGRIDTSLNKEDTTIQTIHQTYTLTSFDPGTYQIPEFVFKTETNSFKTSPLQLQVTPVAVDTTKGIYDIKQPLAVSYTFVDWLKDNWYWVALALTLILALIGLIYYLKKRTKSETPKIKTRESVPAHVQALNRLSALRDKKLWQQELIKEYYSEVSDILREYLEARYVIKALEQTTGEIVAALKHKNMDVSNRNLLRQILTLADLVKFAKEKPAPNENEQILEDAVQFVTQTQLLVSQITADKNGIV